MQNPNTHRPLIAIVPSHDGGKMMLNKLYMDAIWYAGGIPAMLSYTDDPARLADYAETFDGFLFSGGVDVNPVKYGEEKMFDSVEIDDARDCFEESLFKLVYPTGKPVLGICRGIQSVNVWLGGTLHQHIDGHRQNVPPEERTHPISINEGSLFHRICGKTEVMVNTFHHQAVKVPAPGLTVDAVNPEGIPEVVHEEGHRFLLGVQFHPEFYFSREDDDHSSAVFKAFVAACQA